MLRELTVKQPKRSVILRQRKKAAKALIERLMKSGLSQREIAERLDMTQPAISNALHGHVAPLPTTLTVLWALAREQRVPVADIDWRPL